MPDDPSPLRFRTYASFPALNVGLLLFGSLVQAYYGRVSILPMIAVVLPSMGLFGAAFFGLHGLVHDCRRLAAEDAAWQPSWKPRVGVAALGGFALATAVMTAPYPASADSIQIGTPNWFSAFTVCFALTLGPVNGLYVVRRWWRFHGAAGEGNA